MRIIEGENELLLTCKSTQDGITILRCETQDDTVRLPAEIDGDPVTALGAYALSERAPDLTGQACFPVRVTCGGPSPVHHADAVRQCILPAGVRSIGSYAFYNCRRLEGLTLPAALTAIGGGLLMNCRALHTIALCAAPDASTCLPKLLGETAAEIDVSFEHSARLIFPAYSEELEDLSPAHIFQRRIHGAGYYYRQCFADGRLRFAEYDRALSELLERHDFAAAVRVAVRRLAQPYALSDAAREAYLACLCAHGRAFACERAAANDSAALHFLLSLGVLDTPAVTAACDAARAGGQTAALSVLLAANGGKQAAGRAKSFDL